MNKYRSIIELIVQHHSREEAGEVVFQGMEAAVAGHDSAVGWSFARLADWKSPARIQLPLPTYLANAELFLQHDSDAEAGDVVVQVAKAVLASDDCFVMWRVVNISRTYERH